MIFVRTATLVGALAALSSAQIEPFGVDKRGKSAAENTEGFQETFREAPAAEDALPEPAVSYRLGPGDEVTVQVIGEDDIPKTPLAVDTEGRIQVPLVGPVHASGRTVSELRHELTDGYRTYFHNPQVYVRISHYASQPVSVIGAVKQPGIHQLQGRRSLVEVLSLAGGLREDAGHTIKITRRLDRGRIPLDNAQDDPSKRFSVASADVEEVLKGTRPADNILIEPHDVISVPRAEMVYVIGAVRRSGGFVLREQENISVLQALALAGGVKSTAAVRSAKILRPSPSGGEKLELDVDLKQIMQNKSEDEPLHPDDILFVPQSSGKAAALRAAEAAIRVATGVIIWRR